MSVASSTMQDGFVDGNDRPRAADGARRHRAPRGSAACRARTGGRKPPDGPPTSTALSTGPSLTGASRWRRRGSRWSVVPVGTSRMPGCGTLPVICTRVVPGSSESPISAIRGRAVDDDPGHRRERLDVVDHRRLPCRPRSDGKGGRWSGCARRSSSARSSTVSSPTTNEPDSWRTSMHSRCPVPMTLPPR